MRCPGGSAGAAAGDPHTSPRPGEPSRAAAGVRSWVRSAAGAAEQRGTRPAAAREGCGKRRAVLVFGVPPAPLLAASPVPAVGLHPPRGRWFPPALPEQEAMLRGCRAGILLSLEPW